MRIGKVLPKQKDVMVTLAMNDRETFDALVPDNPIVSLEEKGFEIDESPGSEKMDAEIERLTALANGQSPEK